MYVCLCNGITDRDVDKAIDDGASRVAHVYRSLGHRPRCCKCVPCIRDSIDSSHHRGRIEDKANEPAA